MGGKRKTMSLKVELHHQWQMNSTWNKWNLSLNVHAVPRKQELLKKMQSLQQVFTLPSPTAWGKEEFVKSGFHTCSTMTKEPYMFFLQPAICRVAEMKATHSSITFYGSCVMNAFIWPSAKTKKCWMAQPNVTRKKTACFSQNALKVMHFMFFSCSGLVHDHPMPVGTTVNCQYYCAVLQDKVRPVVHHKQPELPEHGVIVL
jgi:hypothetical protein